MVKPWTNTKRNIRDLTLIGLASGAVIGAGYFGYNRHQHNKELDQARIQAPHEAANYLVKYCTEHDDMLVSLKYSHPIKNHLTAVKEKLAENTKYDYEKTIDGKKFTFEGSYSPDSIEGRVVMDAALMLTKEYSKNHGVNNVIIFPNVTPELRNDLVTILSQYKN